MEGQNAIKVAEAVKELAAALPRYHCDDAVGTRIATRREELGLSQRSLEFGGCTSAYLSRIERGDRRPSLSVLLKLALLLDTTPEYLAWGINSQVISHERNATILFLLGARGKQTGKLYAKQDTVSAAIRDS